MRRLGLCLLLLAASACANTPKLPEINEFCLRTDRVTAEQAERAAETGTDEEVSYLLGIIENRKSAGCD